MWTAPVPCKMFFDGLIGSLAIRMSGLLVRSLVDRWPRWFSATRVPNTPWRPLQRPMGSHGLSRTSDRSILPSAHPLAAPVAQRGNSGETLPGPADLLGGAPPRLAASARRRRLSPVTISFQAMRARSCWRAPRRRVLAACAMSEVDSQGEADGRGRTSDMLDNRGRPGQPSTLRKALIAGAGDLAEPGLAGGGMIFRGQADPSRKVPGRMGTGRGVGVFITSALGARSARPRGFDAGYRLHSRRDAKPSAWPRPTSVATCNCA